MMSKGLDLFHFLIVVDLDQLKLLDSDYVVFLHLSNVGLTSRNLVLWFQKIIKTTVAISFNLRTDNERLLLVPFPDISKVSLVYFMSPEYCVFRVVNWFDAFLFLQSTCQRVPLSNSTVFIQCHELVFYLPNSQVPISWEHSDEADGRSVERRDDVECLVILHVN